MANKPPRPWTVVPHGPIEPIDDNLWGVESAVPGIPGGAFPRRMMIVRRSDGTLLLHNAVPLDESGLRRLAELGTPSILVVPSPFHCIDGHAMKARLGLKAYCPAASRGALSRLLEIDGTLDALPPDPAVEFVPLAGVRSGEGVLVVHSGGGVRANLVVCDAVLNIPHQPGFWGLAWRLLGFSGGPRCGPVWLKRAVDDRKALRGAIEKLADTPGLSKIVPSHGPVIEGDVAAVLRAVAAPL